VTSLVKIVSPKEAFALLQMAQERCDASLTGFEFMSAQSTQVVKDYFPEVARQAESIIGGIGQSPLGGSDCVLIEISHPYSEEAAIDMTESLVMSAIEKEVAQDAIVAQSIAQSRALWHLRESITLGAAEDGAQVKLDIALPLSKLAEFIQQMGHELLTAFPGVRLHNFGHFGDGNLHYNIGAPLGLAANQSPENRKSIYLDYIERNELCIRRMVHDRVMAMNGSISAEHGLGQLRKGEAARLKSPIELQLMKSIKQALDPKGILNPGKVID
jgi:FAD/FMN-containing dehydrogenase